MLAVTAALLAVTVAAALWTAEPQDPFARRVLDRIEALRPDVEAELGDTLPRRICVVTDSRERLSEELERQRASILRAVLSGDAAAREAEFLGPWHVLHGTGCVDRAGALHVCRDALEGVPGDDLMSQLLATALAPPGEIDDAALDRRIVHDLVRVWQVREHDAFEFLDAAGDRADLLARLAVLAGHPEAVAARVAERRGLPIDLLHPEQYAADPSLTGPASFAEMHAGGSALAFPLVEGRAFAASALARLGREDGFRRMLDDPPALVQVARPGTWPGAAPEPAGTDAAARRMRDALSLDWRSATSEPLPPGAAGAWLALLDTATRDDALGGVIEMQILDAKGPGSWHRLGASLFAATDDIAAQRLLEAWIAAARARDAWVPATARLRGVRVRDSAWTSVPLDGAVVAVAERAVPHFGSRASHECAVALRRGRHVLEVRTSDDPGGAASLLRRTRLLLACLDDVRPDAVSMDWRARWRFANDAEADAGRLRVLLGDDDPDVRRAALANLIRRGEAFDAGRALRDPDPWVRVTALTARRDVAELDAATRDPDPWVAAGAFAGADTEDVPVETIRAGLGHASRAVRVEAAARIGVLRVSDPAAALSLVRTALATGDPCVTEATVARLGLFPADTPGLGDVYAGLLGSGDEPLRDQALAELAVSGPVPGTAPPIAAVLPRLADPANAIDALKKLGDAARDAVPALRQLAEGASGPDAAEVRLAALGAVARITGDADEVLALAVRLLETGTVAEARAAASEIDGLPGDLSPAVGPLARHLAAEDRWLRIAVVDALGHAGTAARDALPAVEAYTTSRDPALARAAARAAAAIR